MILCKYCNIEKENNAFKPTNKSRCIECISLYNGNLWKQKKHPELYYVPSGPEVYFVNINFENIIIKDNGKKYVIHRAVDKDTYIFLCREGFGFIFLKKFDFSVFA